MGRRIHVGGIWLIVLLLLLLCGCGQTDSPAEESPEAVASQNNNNNNNNIDDDELDEKNVFTSDPTPTPTSVSDQAVEPGDVWRADWDYEDLIYEHYRKEQFYELLAPLEDMALHGGTTENFDDAEFAVIEELYYVSTLLSMMEIEQARDPNNPVVLAELEYTTQLYYTLTDAYWQAMHELANSRYSRVMSGSYSDAYIEDLKDYTPLDESLLDLLSQESTLANRCTVALAQESVDYTTVGNLFVELVGVRQQLASASGYASFAEYAYETIYDRDYTPADAQFIWWGVKQEIVPLLEQWESQYGGGEDRLLTAPEGLIDCSEEAILKALQTYLPQLSNTLLEPFQYMQTHHLLDISYDEAKLDIGFTTRLAYINEPFLFNCPSGMFYDYTNTVHEFGHFTNTYYTESDLLYGTSDNDLSELQSQGLELLFTRFYPELFGIYGQDVSNAVLLDMLYAVIDGAMYDEFQQRVYAESALTLERVNQIYLEVRANYGYATTPGCENEWMDVGHNIQQPFYYISYCTSALGALELYKIAQLQWDTGLDIYLQLCQMDTELYYYTDALRELGLTDLFSLGLYKTPADILSLPTSSGGESP